MSVGAADVASTGVAAGGWSRRRAWLALGLAGVCVLVVVMLTPGRALAAPGTCSRSGGPCFAGLVRNLTRVPLTWRTRSAADNRLTLGSRSILSPPFKVGSGSSFRWMLRSASDNTAPRLFLDYRLGARGYELSGDRDQRSLGQRGSGQYVACWEPLARIAAGGTTCSARWGSRRRGDQTAFVFAHNAAIPSVGHRCVAAAVRTRARLDCTAAKRFPGLDRRTDGSGHPIKMTLAFANIGRGPVRVTLGSRNCRLRDRGQCTLRVDLHNAHIVIQNLAVKRAKTGVVITGEAEGPMPPELIPHWRWSTRAGTGASVTDDNSYCSSGSDGGWEDGQGGAYCDEPDLAPGVNESNWMSALSDGTRLSQLTLPGTHDTGTYGISTRLADTDYRAQSLSLANQLQAGIRAIDIRLEDDNCGNNAKCLEVTHGSTTTGVWFNIGGQDQSANVMPALQTFLTQHPNETVVMNIQDEAKHPTTNFAAQVDTVLHKYSSIVYWGAQGQNPPLWAIRGKVVVITQSPGDYIGTSPNYPGYSDPPSGIVWDGTNTPNTSGAPPYVQDHFSAPVSKEGDISSALEWAATGDPYRWPDWTNSQDLNIGFTSAESDPAESPAGYAGSVYSFGEVSDGCSPQLDRGIGCDLYTMNYLNNNHADSNGAYYRYGIIFSDYPGQNLIAAEIAQNPRNPRTNLTVQKFITSPSGGTVAPGGQVTFQVTLANPDIEQTAGDLTADAQNVQINDTLPQGATLTGPVTWSVTQAQGRASVTSCSSNSTSCSLGTMPEFGVVTESYTVTLASSTPSGPLPAPVAATTSNGSTANGQATINVG
jgi:1-phosphatidylinositol phosphodiesterase